MASPPSRPTTPERPGAAANRKFRWVLAACGFAGIGCFFYLREYLVNLTESSHTSALAENGMSGGQNDPSASSGASSRGNPVEKQKILKRFAEEIPKLRQLTAEIAAEQERIDREHPLIKQSREYGIEKAKEIEDRYGGVVDDWLKDKNPKFAERSGELRGLLYSSNFLSLLDSQDKIGDSSLHEVVRDLLDNTQFFEKAKELVGLMAEQAPSGPLKHEEIRTTETPDQLIGILRSIAGTNRESAVKLLNETVKQPDFRAYYLDSQRQEFLWAIIDGYGLSWTSELDAKVKQHDLLIGGLRDQLDRLPDGSPSKGELGATLIEAAVGAQSKPPEP